MASKIWALEYKRAKAVKLEEYGGWLPSIEQVEFCEGCVYGKQMKRPFSIDKAE